MKESFGERIKRGWNAFMNKDPTSYRDYDIGAGFSYRPDRTRLNLGNERSIISSIYNRIAMDVAETTIQHARLDENGRFLDVIDDGLNRCLTFEANVDQTGKAFILDVTLSMFDEGCVAIVPIDTTTNPLKTGSYDIQSMRTAKVIQWYPRHVRVYVYNDRTGQKEEIILPKQSVAIVENPLYSVMNEPNSTLRRLVRKLNMLDSVDEETTSGKLDLIIQLPYVVKSEQRREQANKRRQEIVDQLRGSKYGIAYTDGTEKITQLNRSIENNLMSQIEYLTTTLYSQLGLTQSVFDGTANNEVLTNYYSRTVEPVVSAIVDEMKRKFLTKTAIAQHQTIYYFRDPFKFIPVNQIADIADKFTRNEILTSNELRQIIGMKASNDPTADELRNKNLSASPEELSVEEEPDNTQSLADIPLSSYMK